MVNPEFEQNAFNYPHCRAYAQMHWQDIQLHHDLIVDTELSFSTCNACGESALWRIDPRSSYEMVYPIKATAPLPHPDMPEVIKDDFEEARQVAPISSRAASALLRLSIQKLLKELGEKGENINEEIQSLVDKGLSPRVQKLWI